MTIGFKTNQGIAGRFVLQDLSADITLTAEDTGKVFLLDAVGEAIIIPAAAIGNRGVHYTFIMNAKCITSDWTMTSAGTSDIHLQISSGGGAEADTITAGTGDDAITFELNNADEGDRVHIFSTGTFWMAEGTAHATANITAA